MAGRIAFSWTDSRGLSKVWTFTDAIVSDTATMVNEVSANPVEKGIPTTDHIRPDPAELAFDVLVTNMPLNADGSGTRLLPLNVPKAPTTSTLTAARAFVGFPEAGSQATQFETNVPPSNRDFLGEVYELLETLQGRRGEPPALIEVTSTVRTWPGSFALTRWTPKRSASEGSGLALSLELREVRLAFVQEVATPKPTALRATSKKSKGRQDPTPVPDARKASIAKRLISR